MEQCVWFVLKMLLLSIKIKHTLLWFFPNEVNKKITLNIEHDSISTDLFLLLVLEQIIPIFLIISEEKCCKLKTEVRIYLFSVCNIQIKAKGFILLSVF